MTLLNIIAYVVILVFLIAVVSRIGRITRMPVHLRWELYPVPHEKGRAHYGGSILEEVNWWTKPREKDMIGELKAMLLEILLLKGVWEHNRRLWFGSFPLHFGLYLLMGNIGLLILQTVLGLFGVELAFLPPLIQYIAWAGCAIGTVGAVIMLYMRMFDAKLSAFSTASHYFNIVALGAIYISGLLWLNKDGNFSANIAGFYAGLINPSTMPELSTIAYWHIGLTLFFIIYLPFTHMTHFFTKYFTYHAVRWEDEPNLPGSKIQEKINKQLGKTVTWSAPHIGADGKKNWVDIATTIIDDKGEIVKEQN